MHVLRKIKIKTIFHQVETSSNSARLTTEDDVVGDVKHLILLAKLCLFTHNVNVVTEIVDKATGDTRARFINVVFFEAWIIDVSIQFLQRIKVDKVIRFHHAANPSSVVVIWLSQSARNNTCHLDSFYAGLGISKLIIKPKDIGLWVLRQI